MNLRGRRVKIAIIKYLFNRNIPSGKNTSVEVKVYAECLSCVQLFDLVVFRGTFFVHQFIIGDIRNRHVASSLIFAFILFKISMLSKGFVTLVLLDKAGFTHCSRHEPHEHYLHKP